MDLKLKGKTAIVTGASRGIGRAIALCLAAEGMKLVVAARSAEALQALAAECGSEVLCIPTDLRLETSGQALIDAAVARFGAIDVLVNNAGGTKRGDFLTLSEDDWQDGFALKFFGAMRCSRAAWPHLKASQGNIVNIVGVGGRTGDQEFAIGGSVNAACLNLTKVLADRGNREGVRVNAINPGVIATDRLNIRIDALARERNVSAQEAVAIMVKQMGVPRYGEPAEIAAAVAFLASPVAAYCQGSILDIDGGVTRTL